jgi:hypothetical protein
MSSPAELRTALVRPDARCSGPLEALGPARRLGRAVSDHATIARYARPCYRNAGSPVMACPMIRVWTSLVPS